MRQVWAFIAGAAIAALLLLPSKKPAPHPAPPPAATERVYGVVSIVEVPETGGREWFVRIRLLEQETAKEAK